MARETKSTLSGNPGNHELASAISSPRTIFEKNAVSLQRSSTRFTSDVLLWEVIRQTTNQLSFNNYEKFIEPVCS